MSKTFTEFSILQEQDIRFIKNWGGLSPVGMREAKKRNFFDCLCFHTLHRDLRMSNFAKANLCK